MIGRREFLLAGAAATAAQSSSRLPGRELFLDRHWIDRLSGAELRLATPVPCGSVLSLDRPWEGAFSAYFTVLDLGGRFRLYYRGVPSAGRDGRSEGVTCFAESPDGLHWQRPPDNVILRGQPPFSHNFTPFLDQRPGTPVRERFKALAGTAATGLCAFASADGLAWERFGAEPVLPPVAGGRYDSQNLAFWSISEQRYVLYFRSFKDIPGMGRVRWVSRSTSDDFRRWTEPEEMSFGDAPPEHLYTNQTSPYFRAPHIYVSIAARFFPGRQVLTPEEARAVHVDPGYFKDCSDAVLFSSRGGTRYERTFREAFLRPGFGLENWVSRTNYPALNVIPTGPAEISFFVNRNYGQPTAHLARYSLRLDGFASLHAGVPGGEMVTRPFLLEGSRLELNYSTSAAGSVRCELQTSQGVPLPGFALKDCRELIGDDTARPASWTSGAEMVRLRGQAARLRVALHDADLYSFSFS